MKESFSEHISELVGVWWEWMRSDNIARSSNFEYNKRRVHAENCENLIKKEYEIIDSLNSFFGASEDE
jgi:hypothetical protein|tara:strand:- start:1168 stop:1371 length:204 start_codon:yes stop_codon:yes gene_type:complete